MQIIMPMYVVSSFTSIITCQCINVLTRIVVIIIIVIKSKNTDPNVV